MLPMQKDNNFTIFIRNKTQEYRGRFGDEIIARYVEFYDDVSLPDLKDFFSIFHYKLNNLFKYLNSRLRNGHYTALESRELLYLIDELKIVQSNSRGTNFDFDIIDYYKTKISECEAFLQSSGGSPIPPDFQRIELIEAAPVFALKSTVLVRRGNETIPFEIQLIGSGSYASVFKFKDNYYDRFFALKRAKKDLTDKEYKRFRNEFDVMKNLNSPYVIEVYMFDDQNRQYIMEYADITLDKYITTNNNKLTPSERINLIRQIMRAFIYINSKNVLHRDISTTNILLKKYEDLIVVKVSDFGLVKQPESQLTSKSTEIKGTLNDPKLSLIGFNNYEIRHETYALTRLIYFVMTGRIQLSTYNNQEFKEFIEKGISDDIRNRFENVMEMQEAFNMIASTLT